MLRNWVFKKEDNYYTIIVVEVYHCGNEFLYRILLYSMTFVYMNTSILITYKEYTKPIFRQGNSNMRLKIINNSKFNKIKKILPSFTTNLVP